MFATYGVSDRLDVGVAVPINRVDVKATIVSREGNTCTGIGNPARPGDEFACETYWIAWIQFAADQSLYSPPVRPNACGLKAEASGTATGIGDVVVRTKYSLLQSHGGGVAAGVDVRLPTGDEENLLGIAVGAGQGVYRGLDRFRPLVAAYQCWIHALGHERCVGATSSALISPPDEINYAGGADMAVSLRATVVFDVVGHAPWGGNAEGTAFVVRHKSRALGRGEDGIPGASASSGCRPPSLTRVDRCQVQSDRQPAGVGKRPLSSLGPRLTDRLTWLLGFDYSF
jgi:hypothetical protein